MSSERSSEKWRLLLDDEPGNELLRFTYAKALMDEGNFLEAATQFERLVFDQPDYALGWAFLARCRLNAGDKEGARKAAESGLPIALAQKHEVPELEILSVLDEINSEF